MTGMPGFLETRELAENYQRCREYTRAHASTFYFASFFLPRQKRMAAYAVYAFCRYADNLVDASAVMQNQTRALRGLDALRDQLRYLYSSSPHLDPKLMALRDTVITYEIPGQYFVDLLRGLAMDIDRRRHATFGELRDYCYCVASTVGLIMARIFGVADPISLQRAEDLGIAMQLTNILRDVGEDLHRGRIYLPEDELQRFEHSETQLHRMVVSDSFRDLMHFQIARARDYYATGMQGIAELPGDGSRFCARLMATTYSRILDDIEKHDYDVFSRRAHVPFHRKCSIAAASALQITASRHHASAPAWDKHSSPHRRHDAIPQPDNEYSWIR
jgi:15-cis-phytoene synthase